MNKLTLYIGKTILTAILLVMTLFIGLEFIFSLVNELRYVGTADYTLGQAFSYILLSMPQLLAQTFPMSALVGTLLGLGLLASRHELVVMQAAGLSVGDISKAVLKLALVLSLVVWVMGECLSPLAESVAHAKKAMALSAGQALRTVHGTWMRDGNSFIHINTMYATGHLEGVTRYEFDEDMQLKSASFARIADYATDHWVLQDIKETQFNDDSVTHQQIAEQHWKSNMDPQILSIVGVKDLEELSIIELWQTMKYRQANGLDARPYQLAFWQKIARPFATIVMMFLAIPFVFGPLRSATVGLRLLVGVLVGFTFYIFNQLFGPLTFVYHFSPVVGAWLPTVVFLGLGVVAVRKIRW